MAFTIKQGDTLPNLPFQFFQPDAVTPLDLTNATTVRIIVRKKGDTAVYLRKPCTISAPKTDGKGYYDWDLGDTNVSGNFQYEFEITWASGDIQSIPVDSYFDLVVIDDIDADNGIPPTTVNPPMYVSGDFTAAAAGDAPIWNGAAWSPASVIQVLPPVAPPQIKAPVKIFTRAFAGHGMTGGADDASINPLFGNAYKVTTNGTGTGLFVGAPAIAAYDMTGKSFRFRLRIDDPTKVNALEIYVTTGAGNTFKGSLVGNFVAGESNWVTVPRIPSSAAATVAQGFWTIAGGAPTWTGVTQVQVRIQDKSTGPVSMWVEAIEAVAEDSAYPNGVFVMELDDGFNGQIANIVPILDARGIPATFNPIIDQLGVGGASNWTVPYMQDRVSKAGWEIAVHAYAKTVHDAGGSLATMQADWKAAKAWLRANGFQGGVDTFACNPGIGSPVPEGATLAALRANFRSARFNSGHVETARPADPHKLRSLLFTGDSVANMNIDVDRATAQGGMFIFTCHDGQAGAANNTGVTPNVIGVTNLASVLDHAIANGMAFRTRSDALAGR